MGVFYKILLAVLLFGTVANCQNGKCNSLKSRYRCQAYKSCNWSEKIIETIQKLPKTHPQYKQFIGFFQNRVCNMKNQYVYCSDSGEWPKGDDLTELKECAKQGPSPTTTRPTTITTPRRIPGSSSCSNDNPNCGTFKPDGYKGECGAPTILNNILGGAITKLGEFPYVALLSYRSGRRDKYLCGGALINKWYVLTAAHCVDGQRPQEVILGDYVLDPNSDPDCTRNACAPKRIAKKIAKIVKHEQFSKKSNGQYRNDIALIRLQDAVPLHNENPTVSISSPVCLAWKEDDAGRYYETNSRTVIAGFGQVTNRGKNQNLSNLGKKQKTMRKTKLNLCSDYSSTELCGKGSRGGSNGDPGGALLFREFSDEPWFAVGILSSFTGRFDEKKPAYYTKVTPFLPWIEKNLEP